MRLLIAFFCGGCAIHVAPSPAPDASAATGDATDVGAGIAFDVGADVGADVDAQLASDVGVDTATPTDGPVTPMHALAGINFPPTQGTSNAGAFQAGIYTWSYTDAQIHAANATFEAMRLPINLETANDPASLARLEGFVDQFAGGHAIVCMFGTTHTSASHGDGLPDGLAAMGAAWARIHAVFAGHPNVHYEILNEPFGYAKSDPAHYVADMRAIITAGGLPEARCVLDGMGYADDIQLVANAGWTGDLAYHFYPSWSSAHDQSVYSNLVQHAIGALGPRTWITEFGADLTRTGNTCYETYVAPGAPGAADINALRGLDDALRALRTQGRAVRGAFVWHGWNNGDRYDVWNAAGSEGACKVRLLQSRD